MCIEDEDAAPDEAGAVRVRDDEEQAVEGGIPEVKTGTLPVAPSAEEVAKHQMTHCPYAAWCRVCMQAMGRDVPHRCVVEDQSVPVVEFDYLFMNTERPPDPQVPILCAALKRVVYVLSVVATCKGRGDAFVIKAVLRFLLEAGLTGPLRLRSDKEHSIMAVVQAIAAKRAPARSIVETSPVGSHGSLGSVDRMMQFIAGHVRAMRLDCEQMWKVTIKANSPLFVWLVLHASWIHNRFQPVRGTTPYEAVQGRQYRGLIYKFGQAVLLRQPYATDLPKMEARWQPAIWVGKTVDGDEHLGATAEGVWSSRGCRAMAEAEIPRDLFMTVKFTSKAHAKDGEPPSAVPQITDEQVPEVKEDELLPAYGQVIRDPRRPMGGACRQDAVKMQAFKEEYGATPDCRACEVARGAGHIKACRARQEEWRLAKAGRQRMGDAPVHPRATLEGAVRVEKRSMPKTQQRGVP